MTNLFDAEYAKQLANMQKLNMPPERARDTAFCIAAHVSYKWQFSDLPGFNENDLQCVCGKHKERL